MFPNPPILKLRYREGSARTLTLTWKAAGVPVDLTGYAARMEVRSQADGVLAYALSTSPAGDEATITLGGAAGTIAFGPLAGPLAAGKYDTDLRLTAPSGETGYLFKGTVVVDKKVTEDAA